MGAWLMDEVLDRIFTWFAEVIIGGLELLWDALASVAFWAPDVTRLPQVNAFAATSLTVVNTLYVLAVVWLGILVLSRDTLQTTYGAGDLIPRLIIGLIAANTAMPLCRVLIELTNALTEALTGEDLAGAGSVGYLRDTTRTILTGPTLAPGALQSPEVLLLLLIGLLIAVLAGLLTVQWIIRFGVLIVAVAIAPLALACHGTPHTEPVALLWWRTLLGSLATVILQAFALHTTLTIFLDPAANLAVLGLPSNLGATLNLLIVACLLWGVLQIPAMIRRYLTQARPSVTGQVVRVLVIQQFTRGLRIGRGAPRATTTAAGAGGPPRWPGS